MTSTQPDSRVAHFRRFIVPRGDNLPNGDNPARWALLGWRRLVPLNPKQVQRIGRRRAEMHAGGGVAGQWMTERNPDRGTRRAVGLDCQHAVFRNAALLSTNGLNKKEYEQSVVRRYLKS